MFESTWARRRLGRSLKFATAALTLAACDGAPGGKREARAVEKAPAVAQSTIEPPAAERPSAKMAVPVASVPRAPEATSPASRSAGAESPVRRRDGATRATRPGDAPATASTTAPPTTPASTPTSASPSGNDAASRRREVVWSSDWSTGPGLGKRELTDGSRWSVLGGQGLETIPSSGLGFPTSNALRVTAVQATTGYAFLRKTGLPIPAVGQSNYYRWYFRATMPDGLEDPESHPFQDGNASSQSNWLFHIYHDAGAGRWRPQLRPSARTNAYPNDRWSGPALQKDVTYRFEVQVARTGPNTFQMKARIYDQEGALLHQSDAFSNQTGTATLASNPTFTFLELANLEGLNAGNNGIAGNPRWPFVYGYQAAIAVCRGDWCGAYQAGEGR